MARDGLTGHNSAQSRSDTEKRLKYLSTSFIGSDKQDRTIGIQRHHLPTVSVVLTGRRLWMVSQ